jgi:hypothetical protein
VASTPARTARAVPRGSPRILVERGRLPSAGHRAGRVGAPRAKLPAMPPPRASLAIVVSRGDDWADARALALAARGDALDADVAMFVMDDAVAALAADASGRAALAGAEVEVIACATSAHQRALDRAAVGVLLGSQDDHAAIVGKADRVVAFT